MTLEQGLLAHLPKVEAQRVEPAGSQQDVGAGDRHEPLRLVASRKGASPSELALPLHEKYPHEFKAYAAAMGATFNVRFETLRKLGISDQQLEDMRNGEYVHGDHRTDASSFGTIYCLDPFQRGMAIGVDGNKVTIPYGVASGEPAVSQSKPCGHYRPYDAFAGHYEVARMDSGLVAERYLGEPGEQVKKAQERIRMAEAAFVAGPSEGTRRAIDVAVRAVPVVEARQAALRQQYRIMRVILGADTATEKWVEKLAGLPAAKIQEFRDKAWLLSTPAAVAGLGITYKYESPESK